MLSYHQKIASGNLNEKTGTIKNSRLANYCRTTVFLLFHINRYRTVNIIYPKSICSALISSFKKMEAEEANFSIDSVVR